jgi:hypothetical protein
LDLEVTFRTEATDNKTQQSKNLEKSKVCADLSEQKSMASLDHLSLNVNVKET